MGHMLFNWQKNDTDPIGEYPLRTKNATRRKTQPPQPMPGYHETLWAYPTNVHHTESILSVPDWNVKKNYRKMQRKINISCHLHKKQPLTLVKGQIIR